MKDSADPLEGWPSCEISDRATHASEDVYGHLNTYLYRTFLQFCQTCDGLKITIRLFQEDLVDLPQVLRQGGQSEGGFDRIEVFGTVIPLRHDVTNCFEVSNTVDKGYVGTAGVLASLGPLLRLPSENQHACLIGLYLNATHDVSTAADELAPLMANSSRMRRYISINQAAVASADKYNADLLNFSDAKSMFKDFDGLFKRYVHKERFEDICKVTGLLLKAKNTVIEPWPLRLPAEATQKEFDDLHQSAHDGGEHYVEWKRAV